MTHWSVHTSFPRQHTSETQQQRGILRRWARSHQWTVSWARQRWMRTQWARPTPTNSTMSLMSRYWHACRKRVCTCTSSLQVLACFRVCCNCASMFVRFETRLRRNSIQAELRFILPLVAAQHLQWPGVRRAQSGGRRGGGAPGLPPALQPLQPLPSTLSTRFPQEFTPLSLPRPLHRLQPQPRLASAHHQPPPAASPLAAGPRARPADQRGEERR